MIALFQVFFFFLNVHFHRGVLDETFTSSQFMDRILIRRFQDQGLSIIISLNVKKKKERTSIKHYFQLSHKLEQRGKNQKTEPKFLSSADL